MRATCRRVAKAVSVSAGVSLILVAVAATGTAQGPNRSRVFIRFAHQPGPDEENLVEAAGGEIKYTYRLVPAIAATLPDAAIQGLSRNPNIAAIEPDGEVHIVDVELDSAWGVKRIGASVVHDGGNRGGGVRVAILDTGIDYTHPDLNGNYVGGMDFANDDGDPRDDNGHGTHVAGTVAAEDDGAGVVGVAPQASLYAIKVLSASGSGYWSDIIAGLQWATDQGVDVTNNSYGSSSNPGSTVQAAFDNSYAAGVLHVASAGNSGICVGTGESVGYPAAFSSVIAVAATDSNNLRACFSSTGADVEISAPGVSITSTRMGGGYVVYSGTSMASPHVAGVAALVIASGVSSHTEVRQRLQQTADDLGAAGRDALYGFGLVDADEAVIAGPVNQAPVVSISSPADGSFFDSGQTIQFVGTASDAEDGNLTSAMVWTSNINGQIGTGGSFTANLSSGVHTITARVVDSGGKSGTASRTITVGQPQLVATVPSITYSTYGGKDRKRNLSTTVLVVSQGQPVAGASVSIDLINSSATWRSTGTTGADGKVTFTLSRAPAGCYTTKVVSVVASGFTWDGVTPTNSFCK